MTAPETADIAFIIADLGAGGAQRVVSTLANAMAGRGLRVSIVTFADRTQDFYPLQPAVMRVCIGGVSESAGIWRAVMSNLGRVGRLRAALRRLQAPVAVSFVAGTNILAVLASIGCRWRLVISERNDPARQSLGRIWDYLRCATYRHADLVTANSHGALDTLRDFVPAARLRLVRNPLEMARYAADRPTDDRDDAFLAVGRLSYQKAYDVLLAAFAQVAPDLPGWVLRIAGEGPLGDALRAEAERLGVADRVVWLGRVADVAPLYRDAAIFVMPSRHEGIPNALLEAMASACPAIVSDASPGPLELVRDDETGLVVPVDSPDALAQAMRRLAHDRVARARLGLTARQRAAEHDVPVIVDEWCRLLALETAA